MQLFLDMMGWVANMWPLLPISVKHPGFRAHLVTVIGVLPRP
jgi:hypothetical protein